ncbi:ribose 5-phosphate isomerase B [Thermodesulfobacteriota bacterium]
MDIIIGADHAGFDMKEEYRLFFEKNKEHKVVDVGVYSRQSSDYPNIAHKVAQTITNGEYARGILICGSGIGMSITANRYRGVRAALCHNLYMARMSRQHNDANILVIGGRVIGVGLALDMLEVFLRTEFDGGRHRKRLDLIDC